MNSPLIPAVLVTVMLANVAALAIGVYRDIEWLTRLAFGIFMAIMLAFAAGAFVAMWAEALA